MLDCVIVRKLSRGNNKHSKADKLTWRGDAFNNQVS